MLKFSTKLNLLVLLIFCFHQLSAQDLDIHSKEEKITVLKDSSFINNITVLIKESEDYRSFPIFYDSELEEISDIKIFVKKGKRFKEEDIEDIREEEVKLDFLTSKKVKSILLPNKKEIKLQYKVKCDELMYLTSLHFTSYNKVDTLNYQIDVPKSFNFSHNTILKDSLSFFHIDSVSTENLNTWKIKVVPQLIKPDPLQFFGIYKNLQIPMMRTIVVPESYNQNTTGYMNDWYLSRSKNTKELNEDAKKKIDELTKDITDNNQLVKTIYDYVKNNFKYVAIEIGMGAFIPSHVNDVFLNKQGDCKDLSNFLSEALKYKGIKSDLALAATFNHISDCDFPSLSSANHVICIAYLNGTPLLLDPTDPIHEQNTPVQSLQDRTILIMNKEGGSFFKVDRFNPEQNKIDYQLDLNANLEQMSIEGTFKTEYDGISDNFLKREQQRLSDSDYQIFINEFYKQIFGNQPISNLKIESSSKNIEATGNIKITGKTFEDGTFQYLYLDFIPQLFEIQTWAKLHEGTNLYNPFHKKARININLDSPISEFEPIKHHFKGKNISLNMTIKAVSNQKIECNYDFIFDYIFIDQKNVEITNEILESFKKIINDPLLLPKKNS